MKEVDKKNSTGFLDGLRGFAALYVMIGHARWLLWEGYQNGYLAHPEDYSLINKFLMYFLAMFRFGHEAVLFFFVLSGFVIHLKYARNRLMYDQFQFNVAEYLLKRVKRIYPAFVIALILTFACDYLGRHWGFSIYTGQTPYTLINENIGNKDLSWATFAGNLFFIFPEYSPLFGTNTPTWSLKFEWWFYLLYPFFLLGLSKKNILTPTVVLLFLFVLSFSPEFWPEQLIRSVFSMMLCWWLGVLIAEGYVKKKWNYFAFSSFLTGAFLASPISQHMGDIINDFRVAIGFSGFLSLCFYLQYKGYSLKLFYRLRFLADFSYTLYVIHFPLLVLLSGWLMATNKNKLPAHFGYVILAIVVMPAFAWLVHHITERPFINYKRNRLNVLDSQSKNLNVEFENEQKS